MTLYCINCGWIIAPEGVTVPESFREAAAPNRCDDTACVANAPRVAWLDIDDMALQEETCTVEEFCAANADDSELCDLVRGLDVGEHVRYGGGAQPGIEIRRVA